MRIPFEVMQGEFRRVLLKNGFAEQQAALCARLFAETSRDGIYSHGLNRFPQFIRYVQQGYIHANEQPRRIGEFGVMERWDGRLGPGNLNAYFCMNRAIELSRQSGIGCVALSHTNHWMRAGTYGCQAAEAGCIGIGWTNTSPNMPPWGGVQPKIGNNPLFLAVPHDAGPIMLDISMSQFSYGQLRNYAGRGEPLPVTGGFDREGNGTTDADAILETRRLAPIGYWKGSGLSILLDVIAMTLSGGLSSFQVGQRVAKHGVGENGVSQVFLAFDLQRFPDRHWIQSNVEEMIADLHRTERSFPEENVRYPGENMLRTRRENSQTGIPVDKGIWEEVLSL